MREGENFYTVRVTCTVVDCQWRRSNVVSCAYQLEVEAYDLGEPAARRSSNRAQVRVDVVRNENTPLFFNDSYRAELRQDAGVGSQVALVRATDADQAVSSG